MKLIAYILAFYTLILSCIPCQDEAVLFAKMEQRNQTEFSISHQKQQNEDKCDLCSPFCICACCAGITLNKSFTFSLKRSFHFITKKDFAYNSTKPSDNFDAI